MLKYLYYVPQHIRFINNFEKSIFLLLMQCDYGIVKMLCCKEELLMNINYVGLETYFQTF